MTEDWLNVMERPFDLCKRSDLNDHGGCGMAALCFFCVVMMYVLRKGT